MLRFQAVNPRERHDFEHPGGPIEFGRGPARGGVPRCILQDQYVSKDHVQIVELDDARVRITNLSGRNSRRTRACSRARSARSPSCSPTSSRLFKRRGRDSNPR
jgi:hypothetical protein